MTLTGRMSGIRRMLISGVLGAASLAAAPALADTLGYYNEGPPVVVEQPSTTTTTTYTYTPAPAPPPTEVYEEHHDRDRDRDHGAGVHLDTPIFNFGIGIH
jgi:hypothetical protein